LSSERLDITIDLPQTAYQELGVIAKYADRLSNIRSKALEVGTVSSLMELSKRISDSTQIGQEDLMLLLRGLVNLNALLIKARAKPGQLVDLLTETIERDASPRWKEQYFKQWGEAKDLIATALDWIGIDEAFVGLRKLHLLTFAHQNILTDVKIINELRPVYNSNGDKILHTILTYSMLIDYSDGSRAKRVEFALDASDVRDIKLQCERAEKKTVVAKEALKCLPWQTTVARDTEDSS